MNGNEMEPQEPGRSGVHWTRAPSGVGEGFVRERPIGHESEGPENSKNQTSS